MFESKYGKTLTIGLVVLIAIVIGVLIFFTVDYIRNSNINNEASSAVDRFQEENRQGRNNQSDNQNTNQDIQLNILEENVISSGSTGSDNTFKYKGFPVAGTIQIPKINLEYPILEELTKAALEVSVVKDVGPGLNQIGNTVIVGHDSRNGVFFSNNKNLSEGDEIYITDKTGTKLKYIIYKIYTTTPEDSSHMERDTKGKREVTLSTCSDNSKSRLIICAAEG